MPADKSRSLILLILAEVLAMSVWFAAAAALPHLRVAFGIEDRGASWLTSAVQAGYIAGTLISAALALPDRLDPRRLFAASALVAAAFTVAPVIVLAACPSVGIAGLIVPRVLTGMALAGVYPVGMRIAASWAERDMGLLIGLLVGALTLGSALPHVFPLIAWQADWRAIFLLSSALAALAALVVLGARVGPRGRLATNLNAAALLQALRDPALRLANLGYLGHMWELYAMWAWIGLFLRQSFAVSSGTTSTVASGIMWMEPVSAAVAVTFATIASGAAGCVVGGVIADRWGRTTLTSGAMMISGTCAIVAGLLFGASPLLVTVVCLVWGTAIVADSAQFSSSIAELSPPACVGSLLTIQTSAGFLLTIVTIQLVPVVVSRSGWRLAFALLAIGPYLGALAMWRLRARPEAVRIASGRR